MRGSKFKVRRFLGWHLPGAEVPCGSLQCRLCYP
jgi:hypothetical protein